MNVTFGILPSQPRQAVSVGFGSDALSVPEGWTVNCLGEGGDRD